MNRPDPHGFSFVEYARVFRDSIAAGYRVITLREFFEGAFDESEKLLVNRVDVDVKIDRLARLDDIFGSLGVRASIYVRLHAPAYNLLSFGNLAVLRDLARAGHEIGLHTELADAEGHCAIDGAALLRREIDLLETIAGTRVYGTASHGDMTGFNNLHFWRRHQPADFGLLYEAYDPRLWDNCRYVSDSEWVRWKAYDNGNLMPEDRRSPDAHAREGPPVLHVLTHPESWYDRYIYE